MLQTTFPKFSFSEDLCLLSHSLYLLWSWRWFLFSLCKLCCAGCLSQDESWDEMKALVLIFTLIPAVGRACSEDLHAYILWRNLWICKKEKHLERKVIIFACWLLLILWSNLVFPGGKNRFTVKSLQEYDSWKIFIDTVICHLNFFILQKVAEIRNRSKILPY